MNALLALFLSIAWSADPEPTPTEPAATEPDKPGDAAAPDDATAPETAAETAAETISDGNADLEDARDVLSHDLPPVSEDDELLAQLEEEIMDEELSTLAQPPALQHRRDPEPFKPPPGANVPVARDSAESFSPPASPTARETSTETMHAETAPLLNG